MFDHYADLQALYRLMDEAEEIVPCTNYPDAYYPDKEAARDLDLARKACQSCPLIKECAAYGVKWEVFGMWGGMTAIERKEARARARKAGIPMPAPLYLVDLEASE